MTGSYLKKVCLSQGLQIHMASGFTGPLCGARDELQGWGAVKTRKGMPAYRPSNVTFYLILGDKRHHLYPFDQQDTFDLWHMQMTPVSSAEMELVSSSQNK